MRWKNKRINKKVVKVCEIWFCSKCFTQIDVKDILIQSKTSFGASSPKQIQNSLSKIGLNVSCLRCGNNTFVKQEFIVPIEELTEEYLKKSITKFIQENLNPSVKPN